MNKENYRLLQVDENASDEEIKACYERLKEIYNEEKWKDGEEGNNAARQHLVFSPTLVVRDSA